MRQKNQIILRQLRCLLGSLFLFFLVAHLCHLSFFGELNGGNRAFDLNSEHNAPTLYQSILWCFCSYFCYRIGKADSSKASKMWYLFSFVFFFLGVDEYTMIHDSFSEPLRNSFNLTGAFYFAWVIPYLILLVFLAPFAWNFLKSIPIKTSIKFVISGIVFVTGSLGMEMIGAGRHEAYGRSDWLYTVLTTIEESLEIIGISLFLYFLCEYITKINTSLLIKRATLKKVITILIIVGFILTVGQILKLT